MSNRLAASIAAIILLLIAANLWFGWEVHVFLGRKLLEFTEYLAFWR